MIDFPNAKINLGLRVLDKRPDGFHNISTVMYPVLGMYDILEIVPSSQTVFECAGPYSRGLTENNLCMAAYNLLSAEYSLPPVHIYLYKNIPVGAGLGGGSSDAAFTLKLINVIFSLELSNEKLENFAAKLGSDCAFFIRNTPCHATGRGEIMQPCPVDMRGYDIHISMPGVTVNTAWAYGQIAKGRSENSHSIVLQDDVAAAILRPIPEWHAVLHNDFESVVFEHYPQIGQLKEELYNRGAVYASLSGSGAAVYSVIHKN